MGVISVGLASARERLFVGACVLLLFTGHALYGALSGQIAVLVTAGWALLLLIGAVWPRHEAERLKPAILWPAGFFALTVIMALWSLTDGGPDGALEIWEIAGLPGAATVDRSATLLEIIKLLGLAAAFAVGAGLGERDRVALRTTKAVVYAGAAFAIIVLILFATGKIPQTQRGRLEAFFLNPNTAGSVFAAILCLCVGLALRAARQVRTHRRWDGLAGSIAASLVLLVALLMTNSRAALAIGAAALFFIIACQVLSRRMSWRHAVAVVGAMGSVIVLALILSGRVLSRMQSLDKDSTLRGFIFDTHWRAFLESPLTGYGLGSFDTINRSLLTEQSFASLWNIRAAENVYLQWLEEAGILGAAPMFICIGLIIAFTAFQITRKRSMLGPLHALLAVDLLFLLHGVFDFGLQTPSVSLFWAFLLGLQLSWSASSVVRRRT